MQNIPVRHINPTRKEPGLSGSFAIRDVRSLLDGKDMIQESEPDIYATGPGLCEFFKILLSASLRIQCRKGECSNNK